MRSTYTFKRAQKYGGNGSSNILHHSKTRQDRRQFSNEQDSGPPNFCNAISQFNIDVMKTSQGLLTHEWRPSDRTPGWWSSRRATSSLNLELEQILENRYQDVYFYSPDDGGLGFFRRCANSARNMAYMSGMYTGLGPQGAPGIGLWRVSMGLINGLAVGDVLMVSG